VDDVHRRDVVHEHGEEKVSSWAAPGTGSDGGAPAGPDVRRQGRDWQSAFSSMGSFSVIALAILGISHAGIEEI
jgi:hypothetical protein